MCVCVFVCMCVFVCVYSELLMLITRDVTFLVDIFRVQTVQLLGVTRFTWLPLIPK